MFNAKNVLKVMLELGVSATQTNSHDNTFLHCMIAYASMESEDHEKQYTETISWIQSLISWDDFRVVILTENSDGLRPLELAAHLGTFILFTYLLQTKGIYLSKTVDLNLYTVQYYDITDYVTGNRFYTSPIYTIMNLDYSKLDQKSTKDIFKNDPMATWFHAVIHANTPFIVIYALLRITVILNFFASLVITKRADDNVFHNTTNVSDGKYCADSEVMANNVLPILLFYNIGVCTVLLVIDFANVFLTFTSHTKVKWKLKLVSRRKNTTYNLGLVNLFGWASWIGIFIMSISMLKQHLVNKGIPCLSPTSTDIMVMIGVLGSIWDILFFLQLVPGLGLYVIAVQQMLTDFMSFSIILAFFFFSYSIGFHLLREDTFNFGTSLYGTFRLMLNTIDFSHSNSALQIFHAAFTFLIVYLLLNILIAIFISSFEYVNEHRKILARVQSLAAASYFDLLFSKVMMPIYNKLRKKHLVVKDGKVYVTKVIMKTVHMELSRDGYC